MAERVILEVENLETRLGGERRLLGRARPPVRAVAGVSLALRENVILGSLQARKRSHAVLAPPATAPYTPSVSTLERSCRYIIRTPGVRGGHARIEGTRVAVHDVVGLLQSGETVDSLVGRCLPDLTRAQVYECLAYYEDHRGEIDVLVARQMSSIDS